MSEVTLYDLPSNGKCSCWSLNPWKSRMLLNFKGIDYTTEWIEYPDLAPTFKKFGLPPNDKNDPGYFTDYTIPAVRLDDGTYVMDSWKIAQELEKRYPNPSLHLDSPLVQQVTQGVMKIMKPMIPLVIPKVRHLLNEPSQEFFERTRKEAFGRPLAEVEKTAGEHNLKECEPATKEMAELLKKEQGPFFMGKTVSYADFIFVGLLQFLKRVDQNVYDRIMATDPAYTELYEASKQWLGRDDH